MKTKKITYAAALIVLVLVSGIEGAILTNQKPITKIKTVVKQKNVIVFKDSKDEFSEQKLKEYLLELNLKYPEVILAQAKLESGNFTSRAFREQNNLFGMHVARSRPTLAKKGRGLLAHYSSWRDSVIDYALLVSDRMRKLNTREAYFAYLDANYDAPGYSSKLLKFI
jgi:uncharacterized FlgJ-related protein